MNASTIFSSISVALLTSLCAAQGPDLLFTTTQPEQTASGSGGTSLAELRPNEIAQLSFPSTCTSLSAEKWAPRTCFHTMAGDEDGDDAYWEPNLFGRIDALLTIPSASGVLAVNQRTVFYSPSVAMGTGVSGSPGLRPGDIGRIVRDTAGIDGQVEHFLTAEQVQIALGLPPSPAVVNLDACAFERSSGIYFSLENNRVVNTMCGLNLVRDGDVLVIPSFAITFDVSGNVNTVANGCALMVYTENQMNAFVQNAQVTNRNGVCQNQIIDCDALEILPSLAPAYFLQSCWGILINVPHFVFAGQSLTGASVLNTLSGGSIHSSPCGPLGTSCGFGPSFGNQMGLLPPSGTQGVVSSINALNRARVCRFVTQTPSPQIPVMTAVQLDIASPGATTWVFFSIAPSGPFAVPTSTAYWGTSSCFPDFYAPPMFMGTAATGSGFGTYTSVPVPWSVDLVWYGVTITGGGVEFSTPTMVEVL